MNCRKCGRVLNDGEMLCPTCGENNAIPVQPKKKWPMVLLIVGVVVVVLAIIGVVIGLTLSNSQKKEPEKTNTKERKEDKLVCKSSIGNITLIFSDNTILGYTATGDLSYDLDGQKPLAVKYGIAEYKRQFNEWFVDATDGYCEDNGEKMESVKANKNEEKIPVVDNSEKVTVYLFTKDGCPYCESAKSYLEDLKLTSDLDFNIMIYEVYDSAWHTESDKLEELMLKVGKYHNKDINGVPYIVVGDSFDANEFGSSTGNSIKEAIISESNNPEYNDIVLSIIEEIQ